jgi:hypothetical protein
MPDPFVTPQDLTDFLGKDLTADNGAVMALDAACDMIRDITEEDFNSATSTVSLDGTDTDCLLLPQRPVLAAGTVLVDGGTITDYVPPTSDGFLYRGTAVSSHGWSPKWPKGRQNVTVTYDHGYTVAGTVNNVPRSIRMVALMIASRLVVQGVAQSETVGDVTVNYGQAASELTESEKGILYGYLAKRSF